MFKKNFDKSNVLCRLKNPAIGLAGFFLSKIYELFHVEHRVINMIIDFKEKKQRFKSKKNKVKSWVCGHPEVLVNEKRKLIECIRCGQCIEPYDYFLMLAENETRLREDVDALRDRRDSLIKQNNAKEKELRSIKAKIKRAEKKL